MHLINDKSLVFENYAVDRYELKLLSLYINIKLRKHEFRIEIEIVLLFYGEITEIAD